MTNRRDTKYHGGLNDLYEVGLQIIYFRIERYKMKKDIREMSVLDLANRFNQINVEVQNLYVEQNKVVDELWRRIPNLKDSPDIQPKVRKRVFNDD